MKPAVKITSRLSAYSFDIMVKSRRAIPSETSRLPLFSVVLIVFLTVAGGWFWRQNAENFKINGASSLAERLASASGHRVTIGEASLSFPNHLVINDFVFFARNDRDTTLKVKRLEIDLAMLAIATGRFRPKKIKVLSPDINLARTSSDSFGLPTQMLAPDSQLNKVKWPHRLRPSAWPLIISPNVIEVIGGYGHIEDELDIFPQFDGHFDLSVQRSPTTSFAKADSAILQLDNISLFFQGIQGSMSGTISLDGPDIKADLQLILAESGSIDIRGKISNYLEKPVCSFEMKADSFDIKNLALIKYPFINLNAKTSVSGNININNPSLYGKPFESAISSILFTDGKWRIDAISLKLPENKGELTGSIVPIANQNNSLAVAQLSFQTDTPLHPEDQTGLIPPGLLDKIWKSSSINSEITIDYSIYPPQAKEVKLTSDSGNLFTKGQIDLYSGFTTLEGTFLGISADVQSASASSQAVQLKIAGPIFNTDITELTPDGQ